MGYAKSQYGFMWHTLEGLRTVLLGLALMAGIEAVQLFLIY